MYFNRKLPVEFGKETARYQIIIFGVNSARFRGFLRIFQRSTSLPRSCLRRARRASIATNRIRLKPKSKPANIEHWRYRTKPLVSRCQVRSALDYLAIGTHHPFQSLSNVIEKHQRRRTCVKHIWKWPNQPCISERMSFFHMREKSATSNCVSHQQLQCCVAF